MKIKRKSCLDEEVSDINTDKNKPCTNPYTLKDYLKPGLIGRGLYIIEAPVSIGLAITGNIEYSLIPQALTYGAGRLLEAYAYFRMPDFHQKRYPLYKNFFEVKKEDSKKRS